MSAAPRVAPGEDGGDIARQWEEWGSSRGEKRDRKTITDGRFDKAVREAEAMMRGGDWADAKPLHFVALYVVLHEGVYGVSPGELGPQQRLQACGFAHRLLKHEFDEEPAAMAAFVRWTWQREKEREQWRRANARSGGRIGWRLQFSGTLLTDYRIDCERRKGRR